MSFEYAFFILLGLMVIRELWFMGQIQKLLDKAMSRSHHEYQMAQQLSQPKESSQNRDDDPEEDLGALQGFI